MMNMLISRKDLFGYSPSYQLFDKNMAGLFSKKHTLGVKISPSGADIDFASQSGLNTQNVVVKGHYVTLEAMYDCKSCGANLLMPFLIDATEIYIPATQMYSMRRYQRPIADYLMRNVFYAASHSKIYFKLMPPSSVIKRDGLGRDLAKRYLWFMRTILDESSLNQPETMEKLLINIYYKVFKFENPLLESGAEEIRQRFLSYNRLEAGNQLRAQQLKSSREGLLAYIQ